jgi:anti-sigma factor RsiW
MTCKAIERLILESEERPLREEERRAVDGHLGSCPNCRAFQAGRADLQRALKSLPAEELPASLDLETRRACLGELDLERGGTAAARRANVPWPVVIASVLFALLAAFWLTATLGDLKPGDALPWTSWVAVAFIAQGVFVLFLSPVIFRAVRRPAFEDAPIS